MKLAQVIDTLIEPISRGQEGENSIRDCISGHYRFPKKEASYVPLPAELDQTLRKALEKQGIYQLYSHQAEAFQAAFVDKKNIVCTTPTASGKSLSYLLPIFQRKLKNPHSRSLLLYPTKALGQDQEAMINRISSLCNDSWAIYTFDGDTASHARRRIRAAGDFVITNPDMLHSGILPHHTSWIKLFENLEFVVIDELHVYRGVFGSHFANVLRRLLRICDFYGSQPQFLSSSASIANPLEHARRLSGKNFHLIDKDGAPHSQRDLILYNPPIVQKSLGLRSSALREALKLGANLIKNKISTIFFCRSRLRVELLASELRTQCKGLEERIRSYRGGYLPRERRAIERELRDGLVLGLVSTNALELGVDIGALEVSLCVGYPGSISSLLQQFGRAGRRDKNSLCVLIASSSGRDQYIIQNPKYFFEKTPEEALCNPDNLLILTDHIKCAAFELAFAAQESFADNPHTQEILKHLSEERILHYTEGKYYWMEDIYPANAFSLRSGPRENFTIIDISHKMKEKVIGQMDIFSAPSMLHKDAIYIHQGKQYCVEEFSWEGRQAYVRQVNVNYYTDAQEKVELGILEKEPLYPGASSKEDEGGYAKESLLELYKGEFSLRLKAFMFKKLKLETDENLGWGEIHTPEIEMHTQAAWFLVTPQNPIYQYLLRGASESERAGVFLGSVLQGVAYALGMVAPLFVLCDPKDIRIRAEVRSKTFKLPALYCYDNFPGGLELAYRIFYQLDKIACAAVELIKACLCARGCPSCVGLPEKELKLKELSVVFLELLQKRYSVLCVP